jgi:hypothetical protein
LCGAFGRSVSDEDFHFESALRDGLVRGFCSESMWKTVRVVRFRTSYIFKGNEH